MQYLGMPLGMLGELGSIRAFLGVPDWDYSGVPVAFVPVSRIVAYRDGGIVLIELARTSRAVTGPDSGALAAAPAGRHNIP